MAKQIRVLLTDDAYEALSKVCAERDVDPAKIISPAILQFLHVERVEEDERKIDALLGQFQGLREELRLLLMEREEKVEAPTVATYEDMHGPPASWTGPQEVAEEPPAPPAFTPLPKRRLLHRFLYKA